MRTAFFTRFIRWLVIYPVDSVIHLSNNSGQMHRCRHRLFFLTGLEGGGGGWGILYNMKQEDSMLLCVSLVILITVFVLTTFLTSYVI